MMENGEQLHNELKHRFNVQVKHKCTIFVGAIQPLWLVAFKSRRRFQIYVQNFGKREIWIQF